MKAPRHVVSFKPRVQASERPRIISLADLAAVKMWVAWAEERRKGRLTKIPKNPATGGNARVPTDPSTYGTRATAEQRAQKITKGGIGVVLGALADGRHLVGVDLDSCRDPESGVIAGWAAEVIERFDTYAEVSPSGTGVKLFLLVSADDMAKLRELLGNNVEGKPLTRKTFAAGEHREVALDTARFYAVTQQRLKDSGESLRVVPFGDVEWFITEAGPRYLAQQRSGNGRDPYEALGDQQHIELDESGSGYGFRFMRNRRAEGMSYEQAREAILADENEAGEWAHRVDERQLKRAWEAPIRAQAGDTGTPLHAVTICAADVKMRPKEWLWEGHLLRGALELLTGLPGLGKSQVHCHYMACATAGLPWPDGAPAIEPVKVIMVTAEDAIDTEVVPRLKAAGADLTRIHILKYIKTDKLQRQFLLAEDLVKLEQAVARIGNVGLICIDPITAYMGGKTDSHKATEVRSQLGPLKDFSERTNVAVSAITHPAKNASARAIDHFIGSQAFIAAARVGHACFEEFETDEETGEKTSTGRILYTNVKYSAHRKMPTLAYKIETAYINPEPFLDIETSRIVWEKEAVNISADQAVAAARSIAKAKAKEEKASSEVVDFLRGMLDANGGWCKQTEIAAQAKALGFSDKELRTARKYLTVVSKKDGFDGPWMWGWEGKRPVRF
jgi:putative DNA primase/helicase